MVAVGPYLLLVIIINLCMFIPAWLLQTDKITDMTYTLSFIIGAAAALLHSTPQQNTDYVIFAMITIWAIRLGGYLGYRIIKTGRDKRFDTMRPSFINFFQFWFFQGIAVAIISIAHVTHLCYSKTTWNMAAWVGIVIWVIGLLTETIADIHKYRFLNNPTNRGTFLRTGLYAFCRYPSYLGEILIWIGVYLFASAHLTPLNSIFAWISPVFVTYMISFISGIPLLESELQKVFGNNATYQEYTARVPQLLPRNGIYILLLLALVWGIFI